MTDDELKDKIIAQAWRLFGLWYHIEWHTEEYSRVRNGLWELLKESDPRWVLRFQRPSGRGEHMDK